MKRTDIRAAMHAGTALARILPRDGSAQRVTVLDEPTPGCWVVTPAAGHLLTVSSRELGSTWAAREATVEAREHVRRRRLAAAEQLRTRLLTAFPDLHIETALNPWGATLTIDVPEEN